MPHVAPNPAQRTAAKVAGYAFLACFTIVCVVNFGIHDRLITAIPGETARGIQTHMALFRLGMLGDVLYCAGLASWSAALYVILKPAGHGVALFATICRVVWLFVWLTVTLHLNDGLSLLGDDGVQRGVPAPQLQALVQFYVDRRAEDYFFGLPFNTLASAACCYLWLVSRYLPRPLAIYGLVVSVWGVTCSLIYLAWPGFGALVNIWWFDTPMGLFDLGTSIWLLARGLNT